MTLCISNPFLFLSLLVQPLSDEFKQYVLNLDIEADARLLRERLNICEEAIDIFRASSSLLKAGVKAGLSLYSIAVMCCRNDNLGEIPSKLERLSSMASELSCIALENEKWHHSAASRALVDQLSPKRSSHMTRDRLSGYRLHKSVSSGEFLSLGTDVDENLSQQTAKCESPGMANSSASDSSSGSDSIDGLAEPEECEEWAALIIADVSVDQIPTTTRRSNRSGSIASDDGSNDSMLSSSPKGFWHVRPGASPLNHHDDDDDDDDGSIQWSPRQSPRDTLGAAPFMSPPGKYFTLGANANAGTGQAKRPSVSFAPIRVPEKAEKPFLPPSTVNVSEFKSTGSQMIRSKSHSHLSRSMSVTSTSSSNDMTLSKHPTPFSEEYENYRKYYLKFIDLVVVREISAAVHSR